MQVSGQSALANGYILLVTVFQAGGDTKLKNNSKVVLLVSLVGFVASVIGIFSFVTGQTSFNGLSSSEQRCREFIASLPSPIPDGYDEIEARCENGSSRCAVGNIQPTASDLQRFRTTRDNNLQKAYEFGGEKCKSTYSSAVPFMLRNKRVSLAPT